MGGGITLGWGFNMDSGSAVPVEKWTHVAITMDWTVKRASMYIDGKLAERWKVSLLVKYITPCENEQVVL